MNHHWQATGCLLWLISWWRHRLETFSTLLVLCAGNSPVTGEFPSKRPVTRSFDVFFDRRLNKRLSKHSIRRWFETPAHSLWCHCNVMNKKYDIITPGPDRATNLHTVKSQAYHNGCTASPPADAKHRDELTCPKNREHIAMCCITNIDICCCFSVRSLELVGQPLWTKIAMESRYDTVPYSMVLHTASTWMVTVQR